MESLQISKLGSPRRFQSMEFHYDSELPSTCTTPYVSAPSSPGRGIIVGGGNSGNENVSSSGGFYFSAPTSPNRSAAILSEFAKSTRAVVPFVWEDKPGVPKKMAEDFDAGEANIVNGTDFEFSARFTIPDGGVNPDGILSTADELFCNGQIRPLRLPPRLQQLPGPPGFEFESGPWNLSNPQSPRSPMKEGRRMIRSALSGITRGGREKDFDPFAAALAEARKEEEGEGEAEMRGRGGDRSAASAAARRRTRSLSPLRIFHWEEPPTPPPRKSDVEELFFSTELDKSAVAAEDYEEVKSSNPSKPKSTRRWSFKDFLFRSTSEGRGQSKDRLWGLSIAPAKQSEKHRSSSDKPKNHGTRRFQEDFNSKGSAVKSNENEFGKKLEDMKSSSNNGGSGSFSRSGRKMPISPHELHYTANRAQAEELRRKTFLPYRRGLLGCLGFSSKSYTAMNGLARSLKTVS